MAQSILDDDGVSNLSSNPHLHDVIERAVAASPSRRNLLKAGLGAAVLPFFGAGLTGCAASGPRAGVTEPMFGFRAVATSTADAVTVPPGYIAEAFIPWGEPIREGAPAFKADASNSAADQEAQIGDNHDGMHFFGFNAAGNGPGNRSDEGLLVLNHEYINPEYFYAPDTDAADWMSPFTPEKARKAQAAHGVSVVHVRRKADGSWEHVKNSPYNRRISTLTAMSIQGAAAGDRLMQTRADTSGTQVFGTLNNCANGFTPWGTYLTCEENFNLYFANPAKAISGNMDDAAKRREMQHQARYGINDKGAGYRWHTVDERFDAGKNPNEANRFGWVVEIDPFDPKSVPVKRTGLGRFKHENAELVIAPSGQVVVYLGDDERNEYIYKFVSDGKFDAKNPLSPANRELLSRGTLYVARFEADTKGGRHMGQGRWIALVHGQNGLTAANGFESQAEVLIRCRQAADRVGATMMDRPEWVAANPLRPGEVYCTLTNNNRRVVLGGQGASANRADGSTAGGSARPEVNPANPRENNVWGHIIRWREAKADATAMAFDWDIFVMAGQPGMSGSRAPSANINASNLFNSPDGIAFDAAGRLWIQTDGSFSNKGDFAGMGNNQMLVADTQSGEIRRFMVGPSGCEITGITFTPDRKTMFVNIQHPGEVGEHPNAPKGSDGKTLTDNQIARNATAFSTWPVKGMRPRSATVVVRRQDGGVIAA